MACPIFGKEHEDHMCGNCKHEGRGTEDKNSPCFPCMYSITTVPKDEQACNWEAIS